MKKKLIIFSILAVILLLVVPSIPAAKYNIVLEENRTRFLEEIQNMDIDEIKQMLAGWDTTELRESLRSNIQGLRQQLDDYIGPYIDIELILIILLQITAMLIQGKPSLSSLILIAIFSFLVISELLSGEEIEKTPEMHAAFVQSIFSVIIALESRFMRNRIPRLLMILLTSMLSTILASLIVGTTST